MRVPAAVDDVTRRAATAVHRNRRWLCWLGRAGYLARAVLYLTIGALAAFSAFGMGGKLVDPRDALDELYRQRSGALLLAAMIAGLAGYGGWKLLQAMLDPSREAHPRFGAAQRAGWFVTALLHFALAAHALTRLFPGLLDSRHTDAEHGAASAMELGTVGSVLVAAIALVFLGVCGKEMRSAVRGKLDEYLDLSPLPSSLRGPVVLASRAGIASRGAVFGVTGIYLFIAAVTGDAAVVRGFSGALAEVRRAPFGGYLLGAIAIGLIAFGAYQLLEAKYRRILGES
jgi:hypothetical protein